MKWSSGRGSSTPTCCWMSERSSRAVSRFVVVGILLGLPACGDDSTGPPRFATVVFSYMAPTATDPAVVAMFPQCVQGVNVTHLHAGWRNFQAFALTAMGELGEGSSWSFATGPCE